MSNGQKSQTPTLNSLLQKPAVMANNGGQQNTTTLTTMNPAYSMLNQNSQSQFSTNSVVETQNAELGVCYAPPPNVAADPRWAFARFAGPNVVDVKLPNDSNQLKPVPTFPPHMTPGSFQPMQLRPFIPNAPAAGNPVYFGVEQSYVSQGNYVGPGPTPPQAISTPPMRTYSMDAPEPQANGVLPKFKNNPSPSQGHANPEQVQPQNAPQHRVVAALRQESSMIVQPIDNRISSPGASSSTGGPSSPVAQMRHSPVSPVPVTMYQQAPAGYQNCFPSQPIGAIPQGVPQMVFAADNRFKFGSSAPPIGPPPGMPPGNYQLPSGNYQLPSSGSYQFPNAPVGVNVYANGPIPPHNASSSQQPLPRFRGPLQMPMGAEQMPNNMPPAGTYRTPMPIPTSHFFNPQAQSPNRMPSAFRNANGIVKNISGSNDDRLCDNSPSASTIDYNRTNGRNTPTNVDGRRTSTPASENKMKHGSAKESHPSTPAPNSPGDASSIMDEMESSLSSPSWPRTPMSPHTNAVRHSSSNSQHPMGPPASNLNTTPQSTPSTSSSTTTTPSTSTKEGAMLNGQALVTRLLGDFRQMPFGSYQDWDERRRFFEHYVQFCDSNALQLAGHPSVSKQVVDLFRLYKSVKQHGGYVEVTKKKVWREFCGMFNINQSNSASGQLKKQYSKFLLPYECYYDLDKVDPAPIIKSCESKKKHKPKKADAAKLNAQQQPPFVGPTSSSNNNNSNSAPSDLQCPPISYQQLPNPPAAYGNQTHPGFPMPSGPTPTNGPSNEMAVNPFDDCTIRVPHPQPLLSQPPTQQQQLQYQQQNIPPPHPSNLQYPVRVPNPGYQNAFPPQAPPPVGGNVYPPTAPSERPPPHQFASTMEENFRQQNSTDPYQKLNEKAHPNWPEGAPMPPPPPLVQQPLLQQQPMVPSGPAPLIPSSINANHPYPNYLSVTASPADVVSPPNQYIMPPTMPPRPPPSFGHAPPHANVEQHLQQYIRPPQQQSQYVPGPSQNVVNPPVSSSVQHYTTTHQHFPTAVTSMPAIPLHQPPVMHGSMAKDIRMQQHFVPNSFANGPFASNSVRPSGEFINLKQLSGSSSVAHHRKDLSSISLFPSHTVEATLPKILKRKKLSSKDIPKVDPWRLVMALKSGLAFETSWALNVLTILLYDDSCVGYFELKNLPGLFEALIKLFRKKLYEIFGDIVDVDDDKCNDKDFHFDSNDVGDQSESSKIQITSKYVRYDVAFSSITRKGKIVRIENASRKRPHYNEIEDNDDDDDDDDQTLAMTSKRMKSNRSDDCSIKNVNCFNNCNKLKTLFNDDIDSDEVLTRLAPPVVDDTIENQRRRSLDVCLSTSNIIRALSFIPGNDVYMAKLCWSSFIHAEAKLLTYVHRHVDTRKPKHQAVSVETIESMDQTKVGDEKIDEIVDLNDNLWYYADILTLADDAFVVLSNIGANLDLYEYDEKTVEILLSAVIHWTVCKAPIAGDSLPNAGSEATPPYRCALEILCKLSVFERNVDLILATPPWSRIETLIERLSSFISMSEDVIVREFAIVLLHAFSVVNPVVCVVAALRTQAVSNLFSFLEFADSEMHRVLQYHGMAALRDNPEIIGTSVGMLRRAASILLAVSKLPSCREKFIGSQMRLINFTMSQLMDSRVGSTIAEVLYELQMDETGTNVVNVPALTGLVVD